MRPWLPVARMVAVKRGNYAIGLIPHRWRCDEPHLSLAMRPNEMPEEARRIERSLGLTRSNRLFEDDGSLPSGPSCRRSRACQSWLQLDARRAARTLQTCD